MKRARRPETRQDYAIYWAWVLATAAVLFTTIVRVRLLAMPLERDEGEFAYCGQLILQRVPPYTLAYTMKLPGASLVYAGVMSVLGQTPTAIHIGLLLANLASTVMTFFLGRRLWNAHVGAIAAASFALLSLSPSVYGTAAHATQFVVPSVLGGVLLLMRALDGRRAMPLFVSGMLFGTAFLIKQHALVFSAFGVCWLLSRLLLERPFSAVSLLKRLAVFSLGIAAPFGLTCLMLVRLGVFDTFRFWTFTYAREYATELPLSYAWQVFECMAPLAATSCTALLVIAGVGMVPLLCARQLRQNGLLLAGLMVFSFLAVCPGFYFRAHYFVQMLPALSLLIGLAVNWPAHLLRRLGRLSFLQVIPVLIFAGAASSCIYQNRQMYLHCDPREACSLVYHDNPFLDAADIAGYVREHSTATDRIAVLGSEPEILFYANRHSATGFIYTYGLMEPQRFASGMQRQMIAEIEVAEPKYVVLVSVRNSWLPRPDSDMTIFDWTTDYCRKYYSLVEVADIFPNDETRCVWGDDAEYYVPESPQYIMVYERRSQH